MPLFPRLRNSVSSRAPKAQPGWVQTMPRTLEVSAVFQDIAWHPHALEVVTHWSPHGTFVPHKKFEGGKITSRRNKGNYFQGNQVYTCLATSLCHSCGWRACAPLGVAWDFLKDALPSSFSLAALFCPTKPSAENVQQYSRGA